MRVCMMVKTEEAPCKKVPVQSILRGLQLLNLEDGPFFGLEIRAVGRRRCPSVGQYMLLKHSSPIFIYYIDTPDCHV